MRLALFNGPKTRRNTPSNVRRSARTARPVVEQVEGRQLLTAPWMFIGGAKVIEGTGTGATTMNFPVHLSNPTTEPVTVNYTTLGRTAQPGADFVPVSGTLTFNPGETSKLIPVSIVQDSDVELSETLGMSLSGATNAQLISSLGIGTIVDDDQAVTPLLSVNDVQVTRGLDGSKTMLFTVSLNTALSYPVTVNASTSDGTATAGNQYGAASQSLTFNAGETTKQFAVTVYGTPTASATTYFYVNLTGASVGLNKATGVGILNYGA